MKKHTKSIIIIAGIVFALSLNILLIYPYAEFYIRMRRTIRNAPYIEFHSYQSNTTKKVEEREVAHRLWMALSVLNRKKASDASISSCNDKENPCLAYVAFPIHIGNDMVFDWPIHVYKDGTVLWGIPPKRRRYFYMPSFRDAVMEIVETRIDIVDTNKDDRKTTESRAGVE